MRLEFEGSYEEYVKVFGQTGAWAPSVEVPPDIAKQIVESVEAEAAKVERQASVRPLRVVPTLRKVASDARGLTGEEVDWDWIVHPFGPAPKEEPPPELTHRISDEKRQEGWEAFCSVVEEWIKEFRTRDVDIPQPDRVSLINQLGSGPHVMSILVMSYELRSLQRLVFKALQAQKSVPDALHFPGEEGLLEFANEVAGSMVQLAHMGFPDITGAYDHGTAWRKR